MDYVLTEDGSIKVTDGKPTVIDGDKEFAIDAIGAADKITTITAESNDRRKKLGEVTKSLEDMATTRDDLQTKVDSIGGDNKVKIDELKDNINKAWEIKQSEWETEKTTLTDNLFNATVGEKFATSEVIKKTVLPPDIAKATFGKFFNNDGTANDEAGNIIYSKSKPGEPASFDEAMEIIIDSYPNKKNILRASGSGGGAPGGGGGGDDTSSSHDKIRSGLAKR